MKNDLIKLLTSNEWNELSKEQRIEELQRQIDELKNETEYPVFCYSIRACNPIIVRFEGLKSGVVVKQGLHEFGRKETNFIEHTDKDWKQLPYNKERGLYHTQLVWCWDDYDTHSRKLRFYDAIRNATFNYKGKLCGDEWQNYEPFQGEWPEWAIEAHKSLEGLND